MKSRAWARVNRASVLPAATSSGCSTGPTSICTGGRKRTSATTSTLHPRSARLRDPQPHVTLGTLQHLGHESRRSVRLSHISRRGRAIHVEATEQVNILARPDRDAMRLHGITTRESEPVPVGDAEPDLDQPPMERIHQAARNRSRANRDSHISRARAGKISSGQT